MNIERWIADTFQMDEETWRRHANPWSVYTRFTIVPLLVLAVWSRAWIGMWAVVPVVLVVLWTWWNPRIFPEPASFDSWASKGVFGERVWLNRDDIPVPEHHRRLPHALNAVSSIGAVLLTIGLVWLHPWLTLVGTMLIYTKVWFVDRMVWLFEDMKNAYPELRDLVYPAPASSPS